ncbi:MAG: adenylate/guanylate cyclase domain-containing protein [Ardenticatenaceae bacterium]
MIRQTQIISNVVELISGHAQHLSGQTTEIVELVADIGNRFPLSSLTRINESTPVATALWHGLWEELILPPHATREVYLALSALIKTQAMSIKGGPLDEIIAETQKYLPFFEQHLPPLVPLLRTSQELAMNLTGRTKTPGFFNDDDQRPFIVPLKAYYTPLSWHYILNAQALYLFENYYQAAHMIRTSQKIIGCCEWQAQVVEHYFYHSLILAAIYPTATPPAQQEYSKTLNANLEKLHKFAIHDSPENFLHKSCLVGAEIARLGRRDEEAMRLYDYAITSAKKNGFIHHEALANELFAKFWLARGKDKYAQVHITDAHYCYQLWGAKGKVQDLEKKYPLWLGALAVPSEISDLHLNTTRGIYSANMFDFSSALKASQAISGEIVLGSLLEQLMHIMLENTGAQRGVLLILNHGQLLIEAERMVEESKTTVLQSIPMTYPQAPKLLAAMVNQVASTKEAIVLDDATRDGAFTDDPYVLTEQPKSVLCMPLLNQGQLRGILYLENHLTASAFSPQRLQLLHLLCSQAAISIDKARLVEELETALEQQVQLTNAYSRFVPRELLSFLEKESILDVKLGDQVEKEMSILFSDIRDFTAISEKMTPTQNFRFLNGYFSRMEPVILNHNGFIDKYIGDGIMALFPTNADDALQAAIAMLRRLKLYNQTRQRPKRLPIQIGIGLHTGLLMLGTVGGHNRMDGTVISDAVNLGSRVEELTKHYKVSLLITEDTYAGLKEPTHYAIREIDRVAVKGKSQAVTILEVFDADTPQQIALKKQTQADFESALTLYRQQEFALALPLFRQLLQLNPQDTVAALYLSRCKNANRKKSHRANSPHPHPLPQY